MMALGMGLPFATKPVLMSDNKETSGRGCRRGQATRAERRTCEHVAFTLRGRL
jgi:hypothetical protein